MPERLYLDQSRESFGAEPLVLSEVATEAEVLHFANTLRKIGGTDVLSALLPANRSRANACLIARALNFDCKVQPMMKHTLHTAGESRIWLNENGCYRWGMYVDPRELRYLIAAYLNLEIESSTDKGEAIVLPEHIGNAARAFDLGERFTHLSQVTEH